MRPLLRFIAIAAVLTLGACVDLKEIMALSAALQEQYHAPANVSINNRSHLVVTFQNLPQESLKADSAGKERFARDVALFAKSHYRDSAKLDDITIVFANVKSAGAITITRSDAPYSFATRDLK
jgi:hypothetical protein